MHSPSLSSLKPQPEAYGAAAQGPCLAKPRRQTTLYFALPFAIYIIHQIYIRRRHGDCRTTDLRRTSLFER
ncbi:hypothetical protein K474DRAFT_991966 [Panus rudis PR-1116 ss-1]|nr:hypothetical protein K474DRAFT_991966 [Panus rudis PR-1116 ss-1]